MTSSCFWADPAAPDPTAFALHQPERDIAGQRKAVMTPQYHEDGSGGRAMRAWLGEIRLPRGFSYFFKNELAKTHHETANAQRSA